MCNEEFNSLLEEELKKDNWIVDGNYNRTIKQRIDKCDTVIYLDYSRLTCLRGVIKRVIGNYGKVRSDMGEGCPEKFDFEFLKWIWNFNRQYRNNYYTLLDNLEDKKVLIFKNRKQCSAFINNIDHSTK